MKIKMQLLTGLGLLPLLFVLPVGPRPRKQDIAKSLHGKVDSRNCEARESPAPRISRNTARQ